MAQVKILKWNGSAASQIDTASDDITVASITAGASTFSGSLTAPGLSISGDGQITGASFIDGDVLHADQQVQSDLGLLLQANYSTASFSAGYIGMIDTPDSTVRNIQAMTASVASTTDATLDLLDGEGATFAAGDFVLIQGNANAGLYEVQGVNTAGDPDVVTLKAGLNAPSAPLFKTSAVAVGSVSGTIQKVRVSIIRSASAGGFESASSDTSDGITYTAMGDQTPTVVDVTLESNAAITAGDVVALVSGGAANRIAPADADALATGRAIGIAQGSTGSAGNPVVVRVAGVSTTVTGGGSFTIGDPVYVSTTAGTLTQTAPSASGDVVMQVGIATNTGAVLIDPKSPIVLS
jgi:hypothetical protein